MNYRNRELGREACYAKNMIPFVERVSLQDFAWYPRRRPRSTDSIKSFSETVSSCK
jgi:hypothetical protein